ncbi:hypothetical protein [Serratia rhizosphaerae]
MGFYFDENGTAIEYQVEGRWTIRGDYLQVEHGPNIPSGLYKITNNKVKFPFDFKEVEGVVDIDKLIFSVNGVEYQMMKKTQMWPV